jgi:hypothetical protein
MFKPADIVIDDYLQRLTSEFQRAHPGLPHEYAQSLDRAGRLALTHVARTNALYTNLDSTFLVTEVAMRVIEGRQIECFDVTPEDWLHFILGSLCLYTGFVRGVVPGDSGRRLVTDAKGGTIDLERSRTDGYLLGCYIERSQLFVRHYFRGDRLIDGERLAALVEPTRLPASKTPPDDDEASWGSLLRAAQTIGLGADPRFRQRMKRMYRQLEEAGVAERMGYRDAADVIETYPQRFWDQLLPQIQLALSYLKYTGGGQTWLARLNSQMLIEEHGE